MPFAGRVAIVTGSRRDIGSAVARSLAACGAAVAVAAHTKPSRPASGSRQSTREALSILSFPVEAFRHAFEVNLFGAYALMQLVLADMLERGGGHVVNVSSDAAHVPHGGPYPHPAGPPLHAYATSKAALEHLTRTVAYEMGRSVDAVVARCLVDPTETSRAVLYSEGVLDPSGERRGCLGEPYR